MYVYLKCIFCICELISSSQNPLRNRTMKKSIYRMGKPVQRSGDTLLNHITHEGQKLELNSHPDESMAFSAKPGSLLNTRICIPRTKGHDGKHPWMWFCHVLISHCSCNKLPKCSGLKQQEGVFLQFCRPEFWNHFHQAQVKVSWGLIPSGAPGRDRLLASFQLLEAVCIPRLVGPHHVDFWLTLLPSSWKDPVMSLDPPG